MVKTIINSVKTYFGALDVMEKILDGSKYLNIIRIILLQLQNFIRKKLSDQECQREIITKGKYSTSLTRVRLF